MPPRRAFGKKKPTLRESQRQFLMNAPPDMPPDRLPAFMLKTAPAPREQKNSHEEKTFMDSLFKQASDFYRTGIKKIWLRKNSQGVARTMDGRRIIKYGLGVGVSDGVGYVSRIITQDDVGKPIAVFCAVEGKADKGRVSDAQSSFIAQVNRDGGIGLVAYAGDGVHSVVDKLCP